MIVKTYGADILRKKTETVEDFEQLRNLVPDMTKLMEKEGGIGLSANQAGIDMNFAIINIDDTDEAGKFEKDFWVFANAEIISQKGRSFFEEGCLSFPNVTLNLKRPKSITVRFQDENGNSHEKTFDGLLARAIQHEVDHLNGKLFIDYLSPSKRTKLSDSLIEIQETGALQESIVIK